VGQLKTFGCSSSSSAAHYDTVGLSNFVGADEGGSGVGTMLELARILCSHWHKLNVWIAFFDGEEAQEQWTKRSSIRWTATNNTFDDSPRSALEVSWQPSSSDFYGFGSSENRLKIG